MAPSVTTRKPQAGTARKKEIISLDDSDDDSDEVQAVSKPVRSCKPTASTSGSKRKKLIESEDEEDFKPLAKKLNTASSRPSVSARKPTTTPSAKKPVAAAKKPVYLDGDDDDNDENKYQEESEEEDVKPKVSSKKAPPPAKKNAAASGSTPKKAVVKDEPKDAYEEESEEEDVKPKVSSKKAPPPAKTKAAASGSTTKKAVVKDEPKPVSSAPKYDFKAAAARKAAGPAAPGSKDVPDGAPNCLAGLTIVFTGELESMSRTEAQDLAKKYGARVTGAPSKMTSYVVLGEGAGPKKLEVIKKVGLPTLDEDGFLELIASRSGQPMDEKTKEKAEKDKEVMRKAAEDMEKREKEAEAEAKRKAKVLGKMGTAVKAAAPASSQLWTTKYAPTNIKEICGNKGNVEKLGAWLESWPKLYKEGFKKPGKDGLGIYRAILISGPPGIGKTTAAHLVAKLKGYDIIEMNASDTRSKKLIQDTTAAGVRVTNRTCLIMDEVDGMSAGDRGGVGALNGLIKNTKIPIVLIANDSSTPKMKPLQSTCYQLKFRRPSANEVRARLMSIMFKEKLKIDSNSVDALVASTQADIRQILNLLSTWKLSRADMSFEESKELGQKSEKYTIQTPFSIIPQLLGPYAFSKTNRSTLNDRMDLYFQDFSFVPLFMQENYIKQRPIRAGVGNGPETQMELLNLFSKAADSISDGDLIDRLIHGPEQHWSLLPAHAAASTIRPAYFVYGQSESSGFSPVSFPQWLGQNSKKMRLARQLGDVQIKMRLKVSGSRDEIRQDYLPLLASKVVLPLTLKKKAADEAVDEIMPYLDEYYLNKEDWEALVDLGVGDMEGEAMMKKIPTQTKSTFTRIYNKVDHPVAFHKADMFSTGKKTMVDKGPLPDIEDVMEDDVDVPDEEPVVNDDEANDLKNDKLIKVGGAKKGKGKAAAKPKAAATKPKAAPKKKLKNSDDD
ncbi:hypothetical protein QFC22_003904 [Naganishia vaughanmartiniae]|uniref:Uncharacterized protein n=1 Tax=Naganishia vaughanmartiniae TaxID=1424756 RepID=A0ACC2X5M6_9TREE|nr:hypothetical protein QFC22_003904 [Naganishia vaughanmartiniae]